MLDNTIYLEDKNIIEYLIEKVNELNLHAEVITAIDDNWEEILREENNDYYKWDYISIISGIISRYYF